MIIFVELQIILFLLVLMKNIIILEIKTQFYTLFQGVLQLMSVLVLDVYNNVINSVYASGTAISLGADPINFFLQRTFSLCRERVSTQCNHIFVPL